VSKAWGILVVSLVVVGGAASSAGAVPSGNSPKFLPSGGVRKVLRDPKRHLTIKVVVYGSSGEVKDPSLGTPHSGNHFVAIKFGFRNMAAAVYTSRPALSASITNEKGEVFPGRPTGRGLTKVELAKGETAYGRVFFELRDGTKVRSVNFRPFGPESRPAVFTFRSGSGPPSGSGKPLPEGGARKVLRGGSGHVLKAVFYGVSVRIDEKSIGRSPRRGTHFVAIKLGLRNMGKHLYAGEPAASASIENSGGTVSRALHVSGRDLGTVSLRPGRTVYGRIFFELRNGTKVRSFRFRPFGPKGSPAVFSVGS
jgi:hypothetical protein